MVTNSGKSKRSPRWHRIWTRLGMNLPEPARMGFHAIFLCIVPIFFLVWLLANLMASQFNFHGHLSLLWPFATAYIGAFFTWRSYRSERRELREAEGNVD